MERPIWEAIRTTDQTTGQTTDPQIAQATDEADQGADPGPGVPPPETRRSHRRGALWAGVSVVAVGAVAVVIVLSASGGPSVPGAGMAPADFVVSSTQNTLAQRTADVVISGSVSVAGHEIPLTGTGQADFTTNGFNATISENAANTAIEEARARRRGQLLHGYDHRRAQHVRVHQRRLVDLHPDARPGLGFAWVGSVDPLSQIKLLEKKGATVVPLGTSVIDGDNVSGYSVTFSPSQLQQSLQQEFATGQFTLAEQQQIINATKTLGSFSMDVWFDASGILRRETANIAGGTSGTTGKVGIAFLELGTPLTASRRRRPGT